MAGMGVQAGQVALVVGNKNSCGGDRLSSKKRTVMEALLRFPLNTGDLLCAVHDIVAQHKDPAVRPRLDGVAVDIEHPAPPTVG